jgi:hypothetical protein
MIAARHGRKLRRGIGANPIAEGVALADELAVA